MKHREGMRQGIQQQYLSLFDTEILENPVFKYQQLADYQVAEKIPGSFVYITMGYAVTDFYLLTQQHFSLIGTHIIYQLPATHGATEDDLYAIQTQVKTDQQVGMIADFAPILQSVSHYNYNQCTQLKSLLVYQAWLRNSFNGYADHYAFIELEGVIAGLITFKNKQDSISIDLLVVHPAMRSKGVGKTLINYAIKYAHSQQKSLKVTTQGDNMPANRLYQKEGFLVVDQQYLFFKVE